MDVDSDSFGSSSATPFDDFQPVKQRQKKMKIQKTTTSRTRKSTLRTDIQPSLQSGTPQFRVATSNQFATLAQLQADPAEITTGTPSAAVPQPPKTPKIPPVVVHGVKDFVQLRQMVDAITQQPPTFLIKKSGDVTVKASSIEDYQLLREQLRAAKVEFHTFATTEERQLRYVIRGLHASTDVNDIKSDLAEQGIAVLEVRQLQKTEVDDKGRRQLWPLFLVATRALDARQKLVNLQFVLRCRITVESFRGDRQRVRMCYQCQGFGHSSLYCNSAPRCFRCAWAHRTRDCDRSTNTTTKCCHCDGPHRATSKLCPVYQRATNNNATPRQRVSSMTSARPSAPAPAVPRASISASSRLQAGVSYSDMAATTSRVERLSLQRQQPTPQPRSLDAAASKRPTMQPARQAPVYTDAVPPRVHSQVETTSSPAVTDHHWTLITTLADAVLSMTSHPIVRTLVQTLVQTARLSLQNGP